VTPLEDSFVSCRL